MRISTDGKHPDPSSQSKSKDKNKWKGMSRREKISICHSMLLLKFDKMFCETFGTEIVALEGVLCDLPSKCRCDIELDSRVRVPSSFSEDGHWAKLAWQFCTMARD
jgi:hypothetical protein